MRFIIRSTFALTLVLSLALAIIVVVTHRGANHLAVLFTRPDGSPCASCLLGVEPDTMTFDEAENILRVHPVLKGAERKILDAATTRYYASDFYVELNNIENHLSTNVVFYTEHERYFREYLMTDLIQVMGAPTGVYIQPSGYAYDDCSFFEFHFKNRSYLVGTTGHEKGFSKICPSFDQAIKGISLDYSPLPDTMRMTKWIGFAPYQHYADEFDKLPTEMKASIKE